MLKFDKLAWRGYGVCAVRQFHLGQELSPRELFPRGSAVFLTGWERNLWVAYTARARNFFLPLAHHVCPIFVWWKVWL